MEATEPRTAPEWDEVVATLEALGLDSPRRVRRLDEGGYSPSGRWIVETGHGTRHFVKASRGGGRGAQLERIVAEAAPGPFVARFDGFADEAAGAPAVLVTEELGWADWGVPIPTCTALGLRATLDRVAATAAPGGLASIPDASELRRATWEDHARDRGVLVASGLVDEAWCDAALVPLAQAAARVDVDGGTLVHGDLWRQNWCWAGDERGAVMVDWAGAALGDRRVNDAWAECGVRACGGPEGLVFGPSEPDHAAWAAWMCGLAIRYLLACWEHRTTLPRLHETQCREAVAALAWVGEAFDLPDPGTSAALIPAGHWRP